MRIVSQRGFHDDFLHFFNTVHERQAACGLSFHRGERVIVENVATAAIFQDTAARNVMLKAHARAVQSTPLLSSAGRPLGMLSTHYRKPTFPSVRELLALDRLAVRGAALVASATDGKLPPASPGYALPSGLSIFVGLRILTHFVRCFSTLDEAVAKLYSSSCAIPDSEFVLFEQMHVIAVSRDGVIQYSGSSPTAH